MSNFEDCIAEALKEGVIDEDEADAIGETFRQKRAAREASGEGRSSAHDGATRDVWDEMEAEKAIRKWRAALNKKNAREIADEMKRFRSGSGNVDIGEYLQAKIEYQGQGTGIRSSVQNRRMSVLGRAQADMEEVLHTFRTGAGYRRVNKAKLQNMVRELFGEDTADEAARAFAGAFRKVAEDLRLRFNKAGGMIGKLENWGLPQSHNGRAIRNFINDNSQQAFKEKLFKLLDPEKMKNPLTGKPMGPAQVYAQLDGVIENILTDGWISREPSRQSFGRGMLANQRAEHRFLVFRDADAWLEYASEFGAGDPFGAMMGHLDGMAKDIAALEVLGPNPAATIEWMSQIAKGEAAKAALGKESLVKADLILKDPERHISGKIKRAKAMWEHYTGAVNTPDNDFWATHLANIRNFKTSTALGAAIIPAVATDPFYSLMARQYMGTSSGNWLKEMVGQFASRKSRRDAVRMGAIQESALSVFGQQARYAGTFAGSAWSNVLADATLTMSGLTPWTRAGRHAFIRGAMADFADFQDRPHADLPAPVQRTLQRYDISPAEWEAMRGVKSPDGFLEPEALDAIDRGLADRYLEMLHAESEYAVPSGTLRSRSVLKGTSRPGDLWGEIARSTTMFMSFAATMPMLHGYRIAQMMMQGGNGFARGAAYTSALVFTTTIGGALAVQMKEIKGGRDPHDMTDLAFLGKSVMQGGGLAIYGDFFFADVNRYGGTLPMTVGGPVVELGAEVIKLTGGNIQQILSGDDPEFASEAAKLIGDNLPGSNIWYLGLAWDRAVQDNLRQALDPDAEAAFRRNIRRRQRETGQDYWWAPGEDTPDRGPDLSAAAGP